MIVILAFSLKTNNKRKYLKWLNIKNQKLSENKKFSSIVSF